MVLADERMPLLAALRAQNAITLQTHHIPSLSLALPSIDTCGEKSPEDETHCYGAERCYSPHETQHVGSAS